MKESDRYLKGLLDGDEVIIKEIYDSIFPRVAAYVSSNKGNTTDALDVFHDAMMYIIVATKEKKIHIQSFSAYLYVAAKNIWKKHLKTRVINKDLATLEDVPLIRNEYLQKQESMDIYIEKFQLLSPNCREILSNYFNGWSYADLAEEMNYSNINTVRQRVFKCRSKLIALIKNDSRIKNWEA